jgi:hypothetical protein
MRKTAIVCFSLLSAAALVACSDKVDREGTADLLVEQGYTEEQADCIVDKTVDEFGDERALELNEADAELTEEELAFMSEVVVDCTGGELPDLSIPDVSIPDVSIPDISIPDVTTE